MKTAFCLLITLMLLSACGRLNVNLLGSSSSRSVLSGHVLGLAGFSAQSTVSAMSCTSPVINLYRVDTHGAKSGSAVATAGVQADGSYVLADTSAFAAELGITGTVRGLVIELVGCSETLSRFVTGLSDQDLSQSISLLGFMQGEFIGLTSVPSAQLAAFYDAISVSTDQATAYSLIIGTPALSTLFTTMFGVSPTILEQIPPEILATSVPTTANELSAASLSTNLNHWWSGYSAAAQWELVGTSTTLINTGLNINWTPNANLQGSRTVRLTVGQDNGSGAVNLLQPYRQQTFVVAVADTSPAVVPTLTYAGASVGQATSLAFALATGAGLANCATFSKLGFNENNVSSALMVAGDFDRACVTAPTQALTYTVGPGDGLKTIRLWARDSAGNISTLAQTITYTLDQTAPTVGFGMTTQTAFASALRGGTVMALSWTASDATSGVQSLALEFAADGTTFSSIATLAATATSYSWALPTVDTTTGVLRLTATDAAGNSASTLIGSVQIDSTAPSAPTVSLASASLTNNPVVSLTVGCPAGNAGVYVSTSGTAPTAATSGWQTCLSSLTTTVAGDGAKTIYVWAKDAVGNVSTSGTASMTLDQTAPALAFTAVPSTSQKGGGTYNLQFTVTEANMTTSQNYVVQTSSDGGATWSTASTSAATAGPLTAQAVAATLTFPSSDIASYKVRVTATDAAGNATTITSNAVSIDNTAPVLSSIVLAGGSATAALTTIAVALSAGDTGVGASGLASMQFSESGTIGTSWIPYNASSSFTLSATNGTKTVYAWVRDAAGNVSARGSATISLDFGNPPVTAITSPLVGATYTSGQTVAIVWSCTSTNGLDALPARLSYSADDGATFSYVSGSGAWVANDLSASTGHYDWALPAGVTTFRLQVECKSAAGVVSSSFSAVINAVGWSIFAGDPNSVLENVSSTVALMSSATAAPSIATDAQGNIFFVRDYELLKIDRLTGLVTRFAGDPNNGGCTLQPGQDLLAPPYNQIGWNSFLIGTTPARDKLLLCSCGNIYTIDPATRALALQSNINANSFSHFLTTQGNMYYHDGGYIYKVDLTTPGNSPVVVAGNGTYQYAAPALGARADQLSLPARSDGAQPQEEWFFLSPDESKMWLGCWDNNGCMNAMKLAFDTGLNHFVVASPDAGFQMEWDADNGVASRQSARVWFQSRANQSEQVYFDTDSEAFGPRTSLGESTFIAYAPYLGGMISLTQSNTLRSYAENSDGTLAIAQIGGQNIEQYGNGIDLSKVAFSAVYDMAYGTNTQQMYVRTSQILRTFDFASYPTVTAGSFGTIITNYATSITTGLGGTHLFLGGNYCGSNGWTDFGISGNVFAGNYGVQANLHGCGGGVSIAHPVPDGTLISGNYFAWENKFDPLTRPLLHSNGKTYFYISDMDSGGNVTPIIYSSDHTVVHWIAGRTGVGGHDVADNGGLANVAQINRVLSILEIPAGHSHAGDLLILDGSWVRMITIVTDASAPKIYDVFDLGALAGFPSGVTFTDFVYTFGGELSNGGSNVEGSGTMYVALSNQQVLKVAPTTVSGDTVTGANLSPYSFTGTSLTATVRLALTPAGLLVTQANKKRILRVDP